MGAPVAASPVMVRAALGAGGEDICREMVAALRGWGGEAAERAARGLKKVAEAPGGAGVLWGLRKELFQEAMRAEDVRVRWNLVIVLGRLPLKGREKAGVVDWLLERLGDEGALTRTFAMQALWDLSEGGTAVDARLRRRVKVAAREFLESGTAAMQARARRLLKVQAER